MAALPIVDDAPLFLAIQKGYFRQQGLTVTPQLIAQSTLALPDLLHGSVDIVGGGNYVSYFGGQAKGTFDLSCPGRGRRRASRTASAWWLFRRPTSPARRAWPARPSR